MCPQLITDIRFYRQIKNQAPPILKKVIIIALFICTNFLVTAQVNFDSLNKVIDTVTSVQKKIDLFYHGSDNRRLNNTEFETFKTKITNLSKSTGNAKDAAHGHLRIGWLYYYQYKYNEALLSFFEYLKIAESLKDSTIMAFAHSEIADNYLRMLNDNFAKKHIYFALAVCNKEKKEDQTTLNDSYNYLTDVYIREHNYDSALKYCNLRLNLNIQRNDKRLIGRSYSALALVYEKTNKYDQALEYLDKAIVLQLESGDKKGLGKSYMQIGEILATQKKYAAAKDAFIKGSELVYPTRYASKYYLNSLFSLADCYFQMGDYKNSALYFMKHKATSDSLSLQETNQQLSELTAKYETGKKDAEIALKEEHIKSKTAQNSKQQILIIASCIALILTLVLVFFIYRSFRLNKKNAIQLAYKNNLIEEKSREITDSINYARLIQQSLLASEEMLNQNLKEYFILYKPKDIVSGDFYWASETKNGFLIACVDCTGHGVPGAFMSLIGKENLDKAVAKTNNPAQILTELNKSVKKSLNQNSSNGNHDGMDIAIVRLEKEQNGITKVYYSGANRPFWLIKKSGSLEEIKATKQAIGGFTRDEQEFREHTLSLEQGDTIYIFTDGFGDQFGGENGKRLTTKSFKDLLLKNQNQSLKEQKTFLDSFYASWQGKNEQIDDVLVIGIRV